MHARPLPRGPFESRKERIKRCAFKGPTQSRSGDTIVRPLTALISERPDTDGRVILELVAAVQVALGQDAVAPSLCRVRRADLKIRPRVHIARCLGMLHVTPVRTHAAVRVDTPARRWLVGEERIHPM